VRYNDDKAAVGLADGENFIDSGSFTDWVKENESYKHMVIGVKSSGGGASNGLANSLRANNPTKRDYLSMSMDEKVAFLENNRG
jgi:acetyl esterase/lipase